MHLVILYAWGMANAGDRAITHGTLQWVRRCEPDIDVTVVSLVPSRDPSFAARRADVEATFPGVRVVGNDLYDMPLAGRAWRSRFGRLLAAVLSLGHTRLAERLLGRSEVMQALRDCDLVLLNGGHLLFWSRSMGERHATIKSFLLPLLLVRRLGRRYVLHAQSFGPFTFGWYDGWARLALRRIVSGASSVSVREGQSMQHLTALAGPGRARRVLDAAFFLEATDEAGAQRTLDRHGLREDGFVVVALRLSRRGSQQDIAAGRYARYVESLSGFVRTWLEANRLPLVFVCQVERDRGDTEAVLAVLPEVVRQRCVCLEGPCSFEFLRSFYKRAALVVALRFHALVFALSVGTPGVGVHYEEIGPKIEGLMNDIGCPDLALPLDGLPGRALHERVVDALSRRQELAARIRDALQRFKQETFACNCRQLRDET